MQERGVNSALLSCLGIVLALASTAAARGGDLLRAAPRTDAALAAELVERAPARPAPGRAIRRADDGMFYVEALVNGAPVRFLVDTGASHTILTPHDAARIGARAARARDVVTAAGKVRFGWATLDSISLAGHEVADAVAAIADDRLPVSLLGQDMMARVGRVTIAGDDLWLG